MRRKLLQLIIHPLFLALLITGAVLPLIPEGFERYEAERVDKERTSPPRKGGKTIYKHHRDLFKGGQTEVVELWLQSYYHSLQILDSNGASMGQFTGGPPSGLACEQLFFCDHNGDGVEELFIFPQKEDSLFLRKLDVSEKPEEEEGEEEGKERFFHTRLIDTVLVPNPEGNYRANISCGECLDVNGDGTRELVFNVQTAFSAQPRNLYIYDPGTDSLAKSPQSGAYFFTFRSFDLTGDGKEEFVLEQTKAYANIHPKLGIPYTDTSSYLMVLDRELEFLFEPVEFPHMKSQVNSAPIETEEGVRLAVLYQYSGEKEEEPSLMLFDTEGEKLKERAVKGHKKKKGRNIFSSRDGEVLYLRDLEGTVHLLDEDLKRTGRKAFQNEKVEFLEQKDVDGDGIHELLFEAEDKEHVFITRKDLSHSVELKVPSKEPTIGVPYSPITLKRAEGGELLLSVQNGSMNYLFDYRATPYYHLKYAIFGGIYLGIALLIFVIQKLATYKLERDKKKLEEEVAKATESIRLHRDELQEKNREIQHSIDYAAFIQEATLPSEEELDQLFRKIGTKDEEALPENENTGRGLEHFILFKPQATVSGDFYWCHADEDHVLWAVADCTGHGVPGAFMSMIGNSLLDEVVKEKGERNPARILDRVREGIVEKLGEGEQKDGMDIALCVYTRNKEGKEVLRFAGANNPLYLIREGVGKEGSLPGSRTIEGPVEEVDERIRPFRDSPHGIEIKGDKQAVGFEFKEPRSFAGIEFELREGDLIHIFSDGYPDQFGGEKGKKFRYAPLKKLLAEIRDLSMEEQKKVLEERFEEWKGDNEQIDDVLVMGVRI